MGGSRSYRESHLHKGRDYHGTFAERPHRAMIWHAERRILTRVVREFFPVEKPHHLDFACGTGRILGHLADCTRSSTGVDVSPSMLKVAIEQVPSAEIIQADLTEDDVLEGREFQLITAFRFFRNAEPELRSAVIRILEKHLCSDGLLVFNNHDRYDCLTRRVKRMLGRDGHDGMPAAEAEALIGEAGLRIVRSYPIAVLPLAEGRMLHPQALARAAEALACWVPGASRVAQDTIYLCARDGV